MRAVSNPIGNRLLEKIRLCASQIYISYGNKDETIWICTQESIDSKLILPVTISISMEDQTCFSTTGESIPLPKHVILFHELTHAYHNLSGKRATNHSCDPIAWKSDEEYKTIVGFPSKKGKTTAKITENAFRKAEGLPERFGSWSPSGIDEREALSAARVKLLGGIHERNQLLSPQSSSPPPIALCSISDLGVENRCALLAEIQGVELDFTPKDKTSNFWWIDPSNSLNANMGSECYLRLPKEMESEIKELAIAFFPKLNKTDFKVNSLVFLRFSKQELDIILDSIPRVKDG